MARRNKTPRNPAPREPVAACLRAILPAAVRRGLDPWRCAQLAALFTGNPAAELAAAQALRWQVAHSLRAIGQRRAALILARELLIDCDKLAAQEKALRDGLPMPPLPLPAPWAEVAL